MVTSAPRRQPELGVDRPRRIAARSPGGSSVGVPPPKKTVDTGTSRVTQHPPGQAQLGDRGLGVRRPGRARARRPSSCGGVGVEVAVAAPDRAERHVHVDPERPLAHAPPARDSGSAPSRGAGSPAGSCGRHRPSSSRDRVVRLTAVAIRRRQADDPCLWTSRSREGRRSGQASAACDRRRRWRRLAQCPGRTDLPATAAARSGMTRTSCGTQLARRAVAGRSAPVVIATTTGRAQRASSSCGPACCTPDRGAAIGGLTALERQGLAQLASRRRHRPGRRSRTTCEPIAGMRLRRDPPPDPAADRDAGPLAGLARRAGCSAVRWLRAGHAYGVRAALRRGPAGTDHAGPPRRLDHGGCDRCAGPSRSGDVLGEIAGGAHSMSELDVTRMCRQHSAADAAPVRTDAATRPVACASPTPNGVSPTVAWSCSRSTAASTWTVEHWSDDIERERGLVATGAIVLRCTSIQLRERPGGWHVTSGASAWASRPPEGDAYTPRGGRPGQTGTLRVAT